MAKNEVGNQKELACGMIATTLKELMRFNNRDQQLSFCKQLLIEIQNATLDIVSGSPAYLHDFSQHYETAQKLEAELKTKDRELNELKQFQLSALTELNKMANNKNQLEIELGLQKSTNERFQKEYQQQVEHSQLLQKAVNDELETERQRLGVIYSEEIQIQRQKLQNTFEKYRREELEKIQNEFKLLNEKQQENGRVLIDELVEKPLQSESQKPLQSADQKVNSGRIELGVPELKFTLQTIKPQSLNQVIDSINKAFDLSYVTNQVTARALNLQRVIENLRDIIHSNKHVDESIKTRITDIINNNEIAPVALKLMESFRHRDETINIYQAAYTNMLEYYTQLTKDEKPKFITNIETWDKDLVRLFGEMEFLIKRTNSLHDLVEDTIRKLANTNANDIDTVNFKEAYKDFLNKSTEQKMSINSIEHQLNQMHDRCIQRLLFNSKKFAEMKTLRTQVRVLINQSQKYIPKDKFYNMIIKYIKVLEKENVHLQTQLRVMGDELKRYNVDIIDIFGTETKNDISFSKIPSSKLALKDELSAAVRRYNSKVKKLKPDTTKKYVKRLMHNTTSQRSLLKRASSTDEDSSTDTVQENVKINHNTIQPYNKLFTDIEQVNVTTSPSKRKCQNNDIDDGASIQEMSTNKKENSTCTGKKKKTISQDDGPPAAKDVIDTIHVSTIQYH